MLEVPVTNEVPAAVMGSGLGSRQTSNGDYDITMICEDTVKERGLDDARATPIAATGASTGRAQSQWAS